MVSCSKSVLIWRIDMSKDWVNIRFGVRHLHIGPFYIKIAVNEFYLVHPPEKNFEIIKFGPWYNS